MNDSLAGMTLDTTAYKAELDKASEVIKTYTAAERRKAHKEADRFMANAHMSVGLGIFFHKMCDRRRLKIKGPS